MPVFAIPPIRFCKFLYRTKVAGLYGLYCIFLNLQILNHQDGPGPMSRDVMFLNRNTASTSVCVPARIATLLLTWLQAPTHSPDPRSLRYLRSAGLAWGRARFPSPEGSLALALTPRRGLRASAEPGRPVRCVPLGALQLPTLALARHDLDSQLLRGEVLFFLNIISKKNNSSEQGVSIWMSNWFTGLFGKLTSSAGWA